jgi:predicted permease
LKIVQHLYSVLLLLAPRDFRERYGRELLADLRMATADAEHARAPAAYVLRACADLLATIVRERISDAMRTLSYTLRNLLRTPGVTLVMVLTLAVGIGANVAAFSVINGVLLNPLPYAQSDRIVAVWRKTYLNGIQCTRCPESLFLTFKFRGENTTLSKLAAYQNWAGIVSTGTAGAQSMTGAQVGAQFLDVLEVRPEIGRGFNASDERYGAPPVVMVSHAFWTTQLHGDPAAIGKTLLLDQHPFRVIGVLPPDFLFPNFSRGVPEHPAVMLVLQHTPGLKPGNNGMGTIARLKDGVTVSQAQADLNRIVAGLAHTYKSNYLQNGHLDQTNVVPLREDLFGSVRALLLPMFGAVFIVLLIACMNVANLLIARTLGRQRDLAMRMAIGATRRHVIVQIAAESLVVAGAATVLGVLAAQYALHGYVALNPPGLHRADQIGIDARVVAYAAGIAIVSALLTSILPALMSLGKEAFTPLKSSRSHIGGRANAARSALVVVQIACAFSLVVACGLLVRSLQAYAAANLGYETSHLLVMAGPPISNGLYPSVSAQQAYIRRLHDNLTAIPGVEGVAYGTGVPLLGPENDATLDVDGGPRNVDAYLQFVSPQYFHGLGIPILRGRDITEQDAAGSRFVAVVDREFVKRFVRDGRAIGKHFRLGDSTDITIVGVVPTVMLHYVGEAPYPSMYFAFKQLPAMWKIDYAGWPVPFAIRSSVPPASLHNAVVAAWQHADPREPAPQIATVQQLVARSTSSTRANAFVLGALALIALLLAISGTGSVVAYAIARRTNEIGVRMALGAGRWRMVRALLTGAAGMLAIGLVVGLGLAAAAGLALAPQLYQTPAFDIVTYVLVAAVLAVATLTASFVPAYRAATIDPSRALRYE